VLDGGRSGGDEDRGLRSSEGRDEVGVEGEEGRVVNRGERGGGGWGGGDGAGKSGDQEGQVLSEVAQFMRGCSFYHRQVSLYSRGVMVCCVSVGRQLLSW